MRGIQASSNWEAWSARLEGEYVEVFKVPFISAA